MPLPFILAALARIAGPVLARVGVRAAAGAAAEGAIGTAAQQAGKAAATNAPAFVLDSTKLGNARKITAALGGKVPAAATVPGAPAATPAPGTSTAAGPARGAAFPGSKARAANPAHLPQGSANPPAPSIPKNPKGWRKGTGSWAQPNVPGAASGGSPSAAPSPPPPMTSAPQTGKPQGGDSWASKISKKFADLKTKVAQTANAAMQKHIPDVADQTKGMSWEQRYERLQKAGKLLEPSQVAKSIGTPAPTQNQITEKSEEHEQAANEKYNEAREKARGSAKATAFIGVNAPIALALAFKKATDAATTYAEGQVALARFNGQIAGAVAKFDLADMKRQRNFAGATSNSTRELIETFSKFKDDLQPIKQSVTTILNKAATLVIQAAQLYILTVPGSVLLLNRIAKGIEGEKKLQGGTFGQGFAKFLDAHNKKVGK